MKGGDLSNEVTPRILLVWEGALGFCSDDRKYQKAVRKGQWDKAITYWYLNDMMVRRIDWLFYKKNVRIEVVTFTSDDLAGEIAGLLDGENVPVSRVWYTTPEILSRKIAYMPDLAVVYDPEPHRWAAYGAKGRFITGVNQLGEW